MRDDEREYVSLEEATTRLNLSVDDVLDLVKQRALRARRFAGWGEVEVEVALVNTRPRKKAAPKTAAPKR
jgi:hypothetical protein